MISELHHGDCLALMPSIPDGSVDMVLCDLPYGVTQNRWDSVIPLEPLWEQWGRVTKPNAAIVLFGQGMFTAKLMLSNQKQWRYNLIWKKGGRVSGFLNAKKMPMRNHEDICVFYDELPVFNPQMREGIPLHSRGRGWHRFVNNNYGDFQEGADLRAGTTEKYPLSILDFERPHPPVHPTQKPVPLLEYLIRSYTNEDAVVLDNTMGSGSTGVAAVNTGRRFIGIESDAKYFELARGRILEAENERYARLF